MASRQTAAVIEQAAHGGFCRNAKPSDTLLHVSDDDIGYAISRGDPER
jgi:hypothetical protein